MNASPYCIRKATGAPSRVAAGKLRLAAHVTLVLWLGAACAGAGERQVVHNTVPGAVAKAAKLRPSPRMQKLNLSIGLPLRNREALTSLLREVYDPASPQFRHYLTPAQFTEQFGPTEADYEAVATFARDHGLTITARHANRIVLSVQGTVLDAERAFHVHLDEYQHPTEARTFRAPNQDPTLELAVPVLSIAGLDNYVVPKPCLKPVTGGSKGVKPDTGSGSGGAFEARDFRAAYFPGVTLTGAGQQVGLLEFQCGFYPSDITAFEQATGVSVPVTAVPLNGYNGGAGSANGNAEVSLDIEMAIGMAPGLQQVVVFEGGTSSTTDDILSSMATYQPQINQLSASWTYPIDSVSDEIFQEMAMQGQSFFNASGDGDAYVGAPPSPTDDTNITIVGGTALSTSGAMGSWTGETAWNSGYDAAAQGYVGTGGGISTAIGIPSWQQGIDMTSNQGSSAWRNSPDVALCASNVYVWFGNGQTGAFLGTSCATPAWAGILALANELAVTNNMATIGHLNPAIYSIGKGSNAQSYASLFHDITSGNNEWPSSPTKYVAVAGYDLCTGWGTPSSTNLLVALALPEPLRISPSPATALVFNGPAGGPFSPAEAVYTLTNNGTASLNWAASTPPSWLIVSPTNGSLAPGGTAAMVTASIAPSATNLAVGTYSSTLAFTNLNDHFVQSIAVTLAVVTPPIIDLEPTNETEPVGGTATLSVGVAPNPLVFYQWQLNGTNLTDTGNYTGSASATLSFMNLAFTNSGTYSVIVSNAAGVAISSNAVLTVVNSAPLISMQPSNVTVLPGQNASFSVQAYGTTPLYYHWLFNGTNLANGSKYSGANTGSLVITNCVATNAGAFSVQISNSLGVVTSSVANLSLVPVTAPGIGLNALFSFPGVPLAQNPYAPVIYYSGYFYGTTLYGGTNDYGTVFRLTPPTGAFLNSHSFTGGTDGAFLFGGLCPIGGTFYGVSLEGGTYGDGCIFKQPSSGQLTALTQFNGDNGSEPAAALMEAADGNLYGTANAGGAYGYGTVFRVTTTGTLTTLTSFNGVDGAYPSPTLVQGSDGYLYGTAENGGIYESGAGTLFRISTNGFFQLLYSFGGTNDGAVPIAGLIQGVDGNFYGVTLEGGAFNQGTVFRMTPSGAVTTLYAFTGGIDGGEPWGALIQAKDGNLYGTTQQGGTYGNGTVFQIAPTGNLNTIAQFDGYQGIAPEAALYQYTDGNLYGTAAGGGPLGDGVFYSIVLTNSAPLQITGQPASLSVDEGANAVFAVATTGGPVTAYQWQQNGTNLANGSGFGGATSAVLVISNAPPGAAAYYDCVISSAANSVTSAPATLTIVVSAPIITAQPLGLTNVVGGTAIFSVSATGDLPLTYQWLINGSKLSNGGSISGVTTPILTITNLSLTNGGSYSIIVSNAASSVTSSNALLAVLPPNVPSITFTNLHFFAGGTADGDAPSSALIQAQDGNLYGTTASGGADYTGTIFRMSLTGTTTILYSFGLSPASSYPDGGLVQTTNKNLYGMTQGGGSNDDGVFYRLTNYSTEADLHDFNGTPDGAEPVDSLLVGSDGNLYGTAFSGGSDSAGALMRITPSGAVTLLYSFTGGDDGAEPYAGLIRGSDGNYYGTTTAGGAYGLGTVFKWGTNGVLTTLHPFDGTDGAFPFGGLIQARDGNFYGTASEGGAYGYGTIFRLSPTGNFTTLLSFAGTNGAFPFAALIQGPDGNLYGTAEAGGIGAWGTVFLVSTNGALTTLVSFDGFNGATPEAALLQASNGSFYGTTSLGGVGFDATSGGGNGTIFRIVPPVLVQGPLTATNAVACLPYTGVLLGTATPPAGDSYSYSLISGPNWLTVATNGLLLGNPTNANIGTNTFVIGVADTSGFLGSTNLQIVVVPDPPPTFLTNPIVEPPTVPGLPYTNSIAADATAPYLGEGDSLSFALVSGPAWLSLSRAGALSGTPMISNLGTNTFVVSVADLGGSSNTANLVIDVAYQPPSILLGQLALGTNGFRLNFSGPPGQTYKILCTNNAAAPLSSWPVIGTGTFGSSNVVFTDTNAVPSPVRFYTIRSP